MAFLYAFVLEYLSKDIHITSRIVHQEYFGPPPEFPLAYPCPRIFHHISGPSEI